MLPNGYHVFAGIARIPATVRDIPPVGKPPKPHSCLKLSSLYYLLVRLGAAWFELSLWGCYSGESICLNSQLLDSGTITACSGIYTVLHRLCFVLAVKAWTFELEKHYRTSCLNMLIVLLPKLEEKQKWPPWDQIRRSEETWAFLLLFYSQTIRSPPLYPTPKNIYILNQSQVGLSQEKRKKFPREVMCFMFPEATTVVHMV